LPDVARFDPVLAGDVRATARDTSDLIARLEREIDDLAQNYEPGEAERLKARLDSFGNPEDPGLRKMRDVIADHLGLIKGLQERQAALEERHTNALARLHTLWLQLRSLRAQRALESAEAAEITGRIRALCASVGNLHDAIAEVDALTRTP
jgi:chromosome segregation ATPase